MVDTNEKEMRISAGEQLKHLREQKNLSVKDVATRLNLETRIIDAIEENNFEVLPAATYARGYLRSYAKVLDADPESIIASYNPAAADPPEIIPEVKHTTQTSSSDKPVQAFTYLITLTLVILLIAWLQSNNVLDKMSVNSESDSEGSLPQSNLSYEIPVIEHPSLPVYRNPDAMLETSQESSEILGVLDMGIDDTSIDAETETGSNIVTSDNQGPDALILKIISDSWVEIFDSRGNKVFVNLAEKDQVLNLRGHAPFTLVLGFAEGVLVEFKGETIDTAPFTKGSIARFKLGE